MGCSASRVPPRSDGGIFFALPAHSLFNKERLVWAWVGGSDLLSTRPRAHERPSETLGQVLWTPDHAPRLAIISLLGLQFFLGLAR